MKSLDSTEYYNHNAHAVHAKRKALAEQFNLAPLLETLKPNSRVLDVGCGSGIDLSYIEEAGYHAVGVDSSAQMLEIAKTLAPKSTLLNKNALFYTPQTQEFDGVWMNEFINELPSEQAQRVIAACFQGMKSGGVLGMIVREGEGVFEDREDDIEGPSRMIYLYAEKPICSMIEQTGFQVLKLGRRADRPGVLLVIAKRL